MKLVSKPFYIYVQNLFYSLLTDRNIFPKEKGRKSFFNSFHMLDAYFKL